MEAKPVVISGTSGHASVIADIFERGDEFKIIGFLDPTKAKGSAVGGFSVLGSDDDLPSLLDQHPNLHVIVGIGDNALRHKVHSKITTLSPNVKFANAIHPSAVIGSHCTLGFGNAIMAGVIVNPNSTIGNGVILNTRSSIDHDCTIEDFASIAPGVVTGGNVVVEQFAAVGIGTILKHGVRIGSNCIVGAGSVVLTETNPDTVVYGSPAKTIRKHTFGDSYL